MYLLLKYIVPLILFVIIFKLIKKEKTYRKKYEEERKAFVMYLKKISNEKLLKIIGEINQYGKYERNSPNYKKVLRELKEEMKYSNSAVIQRYYCSYIDFLLHYLQTIFLVFSLMPIVVCFLGLNGNAETDIVDLLEGFMGIFVYGLFCFIAYRILRSSILKYKILGESKIS